jgi:hypothetical protein
VRYSNLFFSVLALNSVAHAATSFSVAEVKPHWQCAASANGLNNVRKHIGGLVSNSTGLIAMIQFEATLSNPKGYAAFGASCVSRYPDPVVVLFDESQFSMVSAVGGTIVGDYSKMPWLTTGKQQASGDNCVADPSIYGERGYAGALLHHTASGEELCVVAGTFPHCYGSWQPQFLQNIQQSCNGRRLLVIGDTNAACESQGPLASKKLSMQDIAKNHSANWGTCSDPAVDNSEPTCCLDMQEGQLEARYWYDRTALCVPAGVAGGFVEQFQVNAEFVCGVNEEHKYTTAVVHLESTLSNILV